MSRIVEKKPRGCESQWCYCCCWWCRQWHSLAGQRILRLLPSSFALLFVCLFSMVQLHMENWESSAFALHWWILRSNSNEILLLSLDWVSVVVPYLRFSLICPGQWTVKDRLADGSQHCIPYPSLYQSTDTLWRRIHKHTLLWEKRKMVRRWAQCSFLLGKWTLPAFEKIELVSLLFCLCVCECLCTLASRRRRSRGNIPQDRLPFRQGKVSERIHTDADSIHLAHNDQKMTFWEGISLLLLPLFYPYNFVCQY